MKIEVKNISFSHENNRTKGDKNISSNTINNFSIEFEQGKFYSVLGPNGSGKTTFLDLLTRFLKPDSGSILFDSQNILSFTRKELAKKIALVSQDYYINFPYTVKEVVSMGRHPHIGRFFNLDGDEMEIVNSISKATEIQDLLERKITNLSGGERQRCIFARALCQKTPILLLDEAFSNMDISHSLKLLKMLKEEIQETNIIVISVFHDINFASIWSDEMIFLKNGEIIAVGSPENVMTNTIIQKVYNIEAKVEYNTFANAKQAYFNIT